MQPAQVPILHKAGHGGIIWNHSLSGLAYITVVFGILFVLSHFSSQGGIAVMCCEYYQFGICVSFGTICCDMIFF